jgi:nucleotide-binding universal stress UspA family protein
MRDPYSRSPAIVVGVDGSRSAGQAALWAIDEAMDRDVPLQLVYAIDANVGDQEDATEVAVAEHAISDVVTAIESTSKPVKIEADIVHSHPAAALLEASRSATMVCVGSTGVKHATQGRIGSTASALAAAAHCPVVVVPTSKAALPRQDGLILAAVDESPASSAVLELGVQEARLRGAPLRVITMQRRQLGGGYGAGPAANRRIEAKLGHRLTHWRRNYPDLDIESVPDHHSLLNYLEQLLRTATPIQLVVVDPLRPGPTDVLLGPSGRAALDAAGCTLLICDRQWWL